MKKLLIFLLHSYQSFKRATKLKERYPDANIQLTAKIGERVKLGYGVQIGNYVTLRGKGAIDVGKGTLINDYSHLASAENTFIKIGAFCSIADFVCMYTSNHAMDKPTSFFSNNGKYKEVFSFNRGICDSITVGSDVWIGTKVVLLSGITIGHGAVIAAGSVVTKDVPPYSVVGGIPAKVLKYRFDKETIKRLLELKWWEWSNDKIILNKHFFQVNLEENKYAIKEIEE